METSTVRSTEDSHIMPPVPTSDTIEDTVTGTESSTSTGTTTESPLADGMRSLLDDGRTSPEEAPPEVVVYLTQNSTTHHKDEVPESLASLKHAKDKGYGDRSLLPISDPYSDGTTTYDGAFGDAAKDMTWWQDDSELSNGQVKIGDKVLTLGAQSQDPSDTDVAQIREDWRTMLLHVGLAKDRADAVVGALLTDSAGNAKLTESGAGASNELAQLIAVFDRAERGEFEIHSVVLSGHHYSDTNYLFGEDDDHNYDSDVVTGDTLNLKDIEALKGVFPKAFSQVKSVMLNACNTYDLDMQDKDGKDLSTNEWFQDVFPNVESAAYWEGIAPGPDMGAFYAGEFILDTVRKDGGDETAYKDARYKKTSSGSSIRSETGEDGTLSDVSVKRDTKSYVYNDYKGMRDSSGEAFHERDDLMEKLYKKKED